MTRYGFLTLVSARGMPVMAELGVMAAEFHQYPLRNLLLATLVSNGLLASIYALFVSLSASVHSLAFLAFTLNAAPYTAMLIRWGWNHLKHEQPQRAKNA
jgi:hypothetical protein